MPVLVGSDLRADRGLGSRTSPTAVALGGAAIARRGSAQKDAKIKLREDAFISRRREVFYQNSKLLDERRLGRKSRPGPIGWATSAIRLSERPRIRNDHNPREARDRICADTFFPFLTFMVPGRDPKSHRASQRPLLPRGSGPARSSDRQRRSFLPNARTASRT